MLGFVVATLKVVSRESVRSVIIKRVPKGTEKLNLDAFEEGYRLGLVTAL
jgi:2-oxoglutarate ferredoxin oxidoreductase subunit gamma